MPFLLQAGVDALSNASTLEGDLRVSKILRIRHLRANHFLNKDYYGKHIITRSSSYSLSDS